MGKNLAPLNKATITKFHFKTLAETKGSMSTMELRGVEKAKNACFFLRGCDDIHIQDCSAGFGTVCSEYAHGMDAKDVKSLTYDRFTCSPAAPEFEAIKTDN